MTASTESGAGPSVMPDVQGRADLRRLPIQRVGITSLRYPLSVVVAGKVQPTVGTWTLDVGLRADQKGAHMSRLVAWLDALTLRGEALTADLLCSEIESMLRLLEADSGHIEVTFPFFIRKSAPISGQQSLMEYDGAWLARRQDGATRISMQATVPVKSLCPCSKEVSDDGAHNQRSHIKLLVRLTGAIDWSELVRFAEDNASCELWGLLKRPDEKWVTERAYANPKFVEDLIRDVALALDADDRIAGYRVAVTNFESIHAHDAYAVIERGIV
ncbi:MULTISPECIES: GTP cyclohydrolase FolE2 [unclassified Polaromonas]|uniref:GTP cyclohydrolase FolE2 n=1 Tax=unclassified Polaromonas TaxID=2638319 RepID=UPI000BCF83FC|nr:MULTISPECIES: GTP cyclohydrolase FolE2 [unclassified Polaromonas]OYY37866.1 MAG: GTP cyclohydrolase I FolE2 [Polaromonas sp. 35-63-35]OYZ21047.1 MAG: GTP cyclohydrolase I FolE2 [Polaromonas sp. 16-63-31]OYZ79416.1 MAG: GTP cyclohydrolase I FolE2 [Polaromonas sp. 24-63-21]OZA50558.1 MAG: GTP cyclohydrolase I FolE2 [Polaromonas sp. 17-63-33]OZA89422.1 MAG: GTP cyclohydrolase I FolE2 [Polaromonas sp. 39-63-25]